MSIDPPLSDGEISNALESMAIPGEPSPSHIYELRSKLLAQTTASDVDRDACSKVVHPSRFAKQRRQLLMQVAALAAAVMVMVLASRLFVGTAAASLRTALDATRQHLWLHAETTILRAGESVQLEGWCSPSQRICAFRSPKKLHFIDYKAGIQESYDEQTNSIFRWRANMLGEEMGRAFVGALLHSGDLQSSFPFHNVSAVAKEAVDIEGQSRIRYSFKLELKHMPSVSWETFLLVAPDSELLLSWEDVHADGTRVRTVFDYPDNGPENIVKLGAKQDAKLIDRVVSSDVVELAEAFQKQVYNFGDYEALVVDQQLGKDGTSVGPPLLRRIKRAGKAFSVYLIKPPESDLKVPVDLDLAWWIANRDRMDAVPLAVCDGESCIIFPYEDERLGNSPEMLPRVEKPTSIPVLDVKNRTGSTTVPLWPALWPEYACRPLIVTSSPSLRFDMDPAGTDGPPNTIRLQLLSYDSPFSKELAVYWLSLEQDHCVVKSIVAQPNLVNFVVESVAKNTVSEYSNYRKSPGGIRFAAQRDFKEGQSEQHVRRRFLVDFEVH